MKARRQQHRPGPPPLPVPPEWKADVTGWDEWMKVRGYTDQTRYGWRHKVLAFARKSRTKPEDITPADLIHYLARDATRSTLRADHSALGSFYDYLTEQRIIAEDPMLLVPLAKRKRVKLPPAPTTAVDDGRRADSRTRLMVLLMVDMGLRRAEVAQIHSRDVSGSGDDMTLTVHGKGDRDRQIPVDREVARLLGDQLAAADGGWLFPSKNHSVDSGRHITAGRVGRIVRRATGWPAHSFRRKFATDTWRATKDVLVVKELLGHASLATTQNYIWTTREELRDALDSLDSWREGRSPRKAERGHVAADAEGRILIN